jgi:sodium/potassium/calcium exchanger 6
MSVLWIWMIAKVLVDILNTIGVIFNISSAFLGMTFLAFGNSAPDLTLNCSLARAGYGEMGLAGSIAGPLFNLLIGLGSAMIKNTLLRY